MPGKPLIFKAFRASLTLVPAGYVAAADTVMGRHLPLCLGQMAVQAVAPPQDICLPRGQLPGQPASHRASHRSGPGRRSPPRPRRRRCSTACSPGPAGTGRSPRRSAASGADSCSPEGLPSNRSYLLFSFRRAVRPSCKTFQKSIPRFSLFHKRR